MSPIATLHPPEFRNSGFCYCCNSQVEFVATSVWWRDHYSCTKCGCIPRERAVIYILEKFFPAWRNLIIHEAAPYLIRGASKRLAAEATGFLTSWFFPDVPWGTMNAAGQRSENLERLTFADASIDLHVTQDVFEHVLDPAAAFREIARTLKPGGAHVFTVPLQQKLEATEFCARREPDGTVVQLVSPPEYHSNPISSAGSLVTVHWGYDIIQHIFGATGLHTEVIALDDLDLGLRAQFLEVMITRKPMKS